MPAVHRVSDTVLSPTGTGRDCQHPIELTQDAGNTSSVFAENLLIVNKGVKVIEHNAPGCQEKDKATLSTCSATVFIGNQGVARIGDQYADNVATKGSSTVFSG